MLGKTRVKGGVVRNTKALERAGKKYLRAHEQLEEFRADFADQIARLAELEENLANAEAECAQQAERHLLRKKSISAGGVTVVKTEKKSRTVDPQTLLAKYPKLAEVEDLFRVKLSVFDRIAASGAYDKRTMSRAVTTTISTKFHTHKSE